MTRYPHVAKWLCVAGLAFGLALLPTLSRADSDALLLKAGSGAAARTSSAAVLGAPLGGLDFSGLIALDIPPSGFSVGPRLTGEGMYNLMDLAPNLRLAIGGRVAFAYHSWDVGFGVGGSLWMLDFVPDAKITYAINDQIGVYGDFGLGLAYMHFSSDATVFGVSASSSDIALAVQFGGGVKYAMTPNINLLGEIRFDIYSKSGSGTFIAIPTVGVQFH